MTEGEGSSASGEDEGKAPGKIFDLEAGDVWTLLVAIIEQGPTRSHESRYACVTYCIYSIAPWANNEIVCPSQSVKIRRRRKKETELCCTDPRFP